MCARLSHRPRWRWRDARVFLSHWDCNNPRLVCCSCCCLLLLNFYCCTQKGPFHLVRTHTHSSSSSSSSSSSISRLRAAEQPQRQNIFFPPPALRAPVNVCGKLWTMRWTSAQQTHHHHLLSSLSLSIVFLCVFFFSLTLPQQILHHFRLWL